MRWMTETMFGIAALCLARAASGGELTTGDFCFNGSLGSQGATIAKTGENHFKITLGSAPQHPDWANSAQFEIRQNARGKRLRLDVAFEHPKPQYAFDEYFYSWSHDGAAWQPLRWEKPTNGKANTLLFPDFQQDRVVVGLQVPFSFEDLEKLVQQWQKNPCVQVHVVGKSLQGRNLYRLTITDPTSPHPASKRWVHYVANQHPCEHNAQWRIASMIDWLLSDAAVEHRKRTIGHFAPMMCPDAQSHGWYRVNAQGVDMNRSYRAEGSDAAKQAHEPFLFQKDLEMLMRSESPVTTVWSMHTWGGIMEPILSGTGPEIGKALGPWEELRDLLQKHDVRKLVKPLRLQPKPSSPMYWDGGPHRQFGVTSVLVEGTGALLTRQDNLDTGSVLMRSIVEYYGGLRP